MHMLDFLEHYNAVDTIALSQALANYTDNCIATYNKSPICSVTLPSYAEHIMWGSSTQTSTRHTHLVKSLLMSSR